MRIKKALFGVSIIFVTLVAYATDPDPRSVTTSQKYVEEGLSNRQDTIPVKSGTVAVAPTSTKGTLAERQVKTTLGNESTNQSDTGITTVATVRAAADNKQPKIRSYPTNNIVTYTGTSGGDMASSGYVGQGVITTTPIYDSTKNTYAGGLVHASTLNTAVATAVSRALTPVAAGFQINDIGNVLPTTVYVTASDQTSGLCSKQIRPDSSHPDQPGNCSTTMYSSMTRGDWGVTFNRETGISYPGDTCEGTKCYKEIRGISACSIHGGSFALMDSTDIYTDLQNEYEASRDGTIPAGGYCHCKLTNPHIGVSDSVSPWVYFNNLGASCAASCAHACADRVKSNLGIRGAILGAVNPN